MNFSIAKSTLIALTLLLSASWSNAADSKAALPQPAASKAAASTKSAKSDAAAKRKAAAKIKLVDINSASKDELKKLPGVKDAEADKIIAGRPYGSKAWLVTHHVIDAGVYEGLKGLVIAKQPNKDAAQNAALYQKKK